MASKRNHEAELVAFALASNNPGRWRGARQRNRSAMKLWGSIKQQANKLAYDAEKALRVKRQEGIIGELREKVQV